MFDFLNPVLPVATVAINMRPIARPWGGSSVFVAQLATFLRARGYFVTYRLHKNVDAILLIDPREDLAFKAFGLKEIIEFKKKYPRVQVLHRINECDQRKASNFMDALLAKGNLNADYTIFISEWLKEYHAQRWFDRSKAHCVIYNGAAVKWFHPLGGDIYRPGQTLRIVTHHWSDNPLKGFDIYQQVDELIAQGELKDTELWVIGRWPKEMTWKRAKLFPPVAGAKLATLLKQCHLYLTGTKWEPCGMHHIEGAQCGLPLLYHLDGGGVVEAGARYGIGFSDNVMGAISEARNTYSDLRAKLFSAMPSGDRMCLEYAEAIQTLIANSRA